MDKYAVLEGGLKDTVRRLFKELRTLDTEKRALEEEVDRLRAQIEESGDE